MPLTIIIAEKTGAIATLDIKEYNEKELYKKCGYKKADDFGLQHELNIKLLGQKFTICVFGKIKGKSDSKSKNKDFIDLEFPVLYGNCALVGYIRDDTDNRTLINLTCKLWENIAYGGMDDNDDTDDFIKSTEQYLPHKITIIKDEDKFDKDYPDIYHSEFSSDDETVLDVEPIHGSCLEDENENENENENEDDKELFSELSEEAYDYSDDER